jgi:hypothetical protein
MIRAAGRAAVLVVVLLPVRVGRTEPPRATTSRQLEYAVVPLAGGDTDIGFGVGALGSVARLDPAVRPFAWRLEGTAFVTARRGEDGLSSPYHDAFLQLTVPGLLGGRARLELRPSFTRETNLRYHGLGNASRAPPDALVARDFFTRTHPALILRGRIALAGPLSVLVGTLYTHSWIEYGADSSLARDLARGDARVRALLHVDPVHGLNLFEAGLMLDTRDDEMAPAHGQYHSVKVRVSPWQTATLPYRYVQLSLAARGYATLVPERLVVAGRLVADVQMGDVPFYELARYDEASALGGANGVRGVPGDRYHGQRKLFANLEARATLAHFSVASSRYALGVTGFFDGGRLWADLRSAPALDGTGVGLKYGTGAGLRLRKGETFVLRADLAWSPDARPAGFYFLAGHLF